MAIARATCKCATCGKEFEKTTVKRNGKEADSWEKWAAKNFDECDECRQKRIQEERAAENMNAAKAAEDLGLPKLDGSEKQVAWAETIRIQFIRMMDEGIQEAKEDNAQRYFDELVSFKEWMLKKKTSASAWIEARSFSSPSMFARYFGQEYKDDMAIGAAEATEEPSPIEIIEPEEKTKTTVCKVTYNDTAVMVSSKYDPSMPAVVKEAGYKWDGREWKKEINFKTGEAEDRAAEIASKLLLAGFPVEIDKAIHDKAVNGTYIPEHKRWITWRDGKLCISGDVDTKGIPGIRGKYAPLEAWESVEEFARLHDYRISPGAEREMSAYKGKLTKATPVPGCEAEYNDIGDSVKLILESSRDVLDELKEED